MMMNMMNMMNNAYTSNLSVILAEDVYAPELRNPKLSGMSQTGNGLLSRLFRALSVKK